MKNKIIFAMKESKILHYTIIFLISLILFYPLLHMNLATSHDGFLHIARIIGVDKIINEDFYFPPMISSLFCEGFGYAINLFYPPIVTFVPLLFKFLTNTYSSALRVFTLITIFLSGAFMYQFTCKVTKNKMMGLISAVLYITAPYHITDIYIRFAIGEFTAFVFIPIVFLGLYNLFEEQGEKHYYIAIGAIGLVLTHSITLVYTAVFSFIYILFYIYKLKEKNVILKCLANAIIILLATAFFTVPILENKMACDYIIFNPKYMSTTIEIVYSNTINPIQFFVNDEDSELIFKIGIPSIVSILFTILTYKNIDEKYKKIYTIFLFFGILSLIMCTKYFPWLILPNIFGNIQFAWRMLGFATFFLSLVGAINIYIIIDKIFKNDNVTKVNYSYIVLLIMLLYIYPMARTYIYTDSIPDMKIENKVINNETTHVFNINREYLPSKSFINNSDYITNRPKDTSIILKGNLNIIEENKNKLNYNLKFEKKNESVSLELPYIFYVGYKVEYKTDDGNISNLPYTESEHGFIQIELPEDITEGSIYVTFTGTTLTKIAYLVSAITLLSFTIWIIYFKFYKVRKKYEKDGNN